MSTTSPTSNSAPVSEEKEIPIEEVRCSVTGMPISSIPPWYANVKVNFVSEQGRKKNAAEQGLPLDIVPEVDPESLLDRSASDYEDIEIDDVEDVEEDTEMEDIVAEGDADLNIETDIALEDEVEEVV